MAMTSTVAFFTCEGCGKPTVNGRVCPKCIELFGRYASLDASNDFNNAATNEDAVVVVIQWLRVRNEVRPAHRDVFSEAVGAKKRNAPVEDQRYAKAKQRESGRPVTALEWATDLTKPALVIYVDDMSEPP